MRSVTLDIVELTRSLHSLRMAGLVALSFFIKRKLRR